MLVQLKIACLLIDTATDQPVIMLQEEAGERAVPIVIGLTEAGAIASELEGIHFPRPMTHDLLRDLIATFEAHVVRVIVSDLRDNTFFARIVLDRDGEPIEIDSRPSDAIALAVRTDAPIFAEEHVIHAVAARPQRIEEAEAATLPERDDPEALMDFLEQLGPEDFGKYKM